MKIVCTLMAANKANYITNDPYKKQNMKKSMPSKETETRFGQM